MMKGRAWVPRMNKPHIQINGGRWMIFHLSVEMMGDKAYSDRMQKAMAWCHGKNWFIDQVRKIGATDKG